MISFRFTVMKPIVSSVFFGRNSGLKAEDDLNQHFCDKNSSEK